MHFEDLELCVYHHGPLDAASWAVPLRAIGWLERPRAFPVGETTPEFRCRLEALVGQTRESFPQYMFRGVHECSLCTAIGAPCPSTTLSAWSQENLLVPGEGEVYAAPGGIVHYVAEHSYRPPAGFVAAILRCPDVGSPEYREALRRANGGHEPPIDLDDEPEPLMHAFLTRLAWNEAEPTRAQVLAAARETWPDVSCDGDGSVRIGPRIRIHFDVHGRLRAWEHGR